MKKLIFIFLVLPFITRAQGIIVGDTVNNVLYYNIKDSLVPDPTVNSSTPGYYNDGFTDIDIDKDNVCDIRFIRTKYYQFPNGHNQSYTEQALSLDNVEFDTLSYPSICIDSAALNSMVDDQLDWYKTTNSVFLHYYYLSAPNIAVQGGVFSGKNKYLAFRKIRLNDTIYGWFLLDLEFTGIKIKSWAYTSRCMQSLVANSSSSLICAGESATLSVSGANSYTWSNSSNLSSIIVTPTVTTSYSVVGTTSNGCMLKINLTQNVGACIGIQEHSLQNVMVYPVPAKTKLIVKNLETGRVYSFSLITVDGKQIFLKLINENELNIAGFSEGLYFLRIQTEEGILSKKIIIQH